MISECIRLKSEVFSSTTDERYHETCTVLCSFLRKLTFDTLSRISYGDVSSLQYSDFCRCLNENYECGGQATATVALVLRPTNVDSVVIIRSRDETSEALFKSVKPSFGVYY